MGNAKLGMERSIEMPNAASAEASDSPKNPEDGQNADIGDDGREDDTAVLPLAGLAYLAFARAGLRQLPVLLCKVGAHHAGARVHDCRRQGDERDKRAAEREEEAVAGQQEHRPPKAPWRHAVQHDRNRQKGREEKGGIVRRH